MAIDHDTNGHSPTKEIKLDTGNGELKWLGFVHRESAFDPKLKTYQAIKIQDDSMWRDYIGEKSHHNFPPGTCFLYDRRMFGAGSIIVLKHKKTGEMIVRRFGYHLKNRTKYLADPVPADYDHNQPWVHADNSHYPSIEVDELAEKWDCVGTCFQAELPVNLIFDREGSESPTDEGEQS